MGAITRRILGVISKQFKCHCFKISVKQGWNNSHACGPAFNLKKSIELGSVAVILVHNYSSGTIQPSLDVCSVTKKLQSAVSILEIKVLTHLIVTEKTYFSFADENLL